MQHMSHLILCYAHDPRKWNSVERTPSCKNSFIGKLLCVPIFAIATTTLHGVNFYLPVTMLHSATMLCLEMVGIVGGARVLSMIKSGE